MAHGMRHPLLALALAAALVPALGCATSATRMEAQQNVRKASSRVDVGADHLANGRAALALREFLAAEKLDPDNPRVQYALGEGYIAQGEFEKAETHLRRALVLHEDHYDARMSLAGLLLLLERYEEVIPHCQRLIDDPTFATPWAALTNRGTAELRLGRVAEARKSLEMALEYRADYWPAMMSLALLESEAGNRLRAIRLLESVVALEPGPSVESEVNYRMGEIYVAIGNRRQALGHLSASVAQAPDSRWARKSQEYMKLLH